VFVGLLPEILVDLIAARAKAKDQKAAATDPVVKEQLEARQQAIKISGNSVYGFTAAQMLTLTAITETVTNHARNMLNAAKNKTESHFTRANGYAEDAEVIYGDTDSIMVKFGDDVTDEEASRLGDKAAVLITALFQKPCKIVKEAVYRPFLIWKKKRYAANKNGVIIRKGVESVRRDGCLLQSTLLDEVLEFLLVRRDVPGAIACVHRTLRDLYLGRIDLGQLVISKSLSQAPAEYKSRLPHVAVALDMALRDPNSAPVVGDRVPYVFVCPEAKAKSKRKVADGVAEPMHALRTGQPIDVQAYVDRQLRKPLARFFRPVLGDKTEETLFTGPHMMVRARPGVSASGPRPGPMDAFCTVRVIACAGCTRPIDRAGRGNLCSHCIPRRAEILALATERQSCAEKRSADLWATCKSCRGDAAEDLCCNFDCKLFYARHHAKQDTEVERTRLALFNLAF
jgi:DNA polymerase delta subunit 1